MITLCSGCHTPARSHLPPGLPQSIPDNCLDGARQQAVWTPEEKPRGKRKPLDCEPSVSLLCTESSSGKAPGEHLPKFLKHGKPQQPGPLIDFIWGNSSHQQPPPHLVVSNSNMLRSFSFSCWEETHRWYRPNFNVAEISLCGVAMKTGALKVL